MNDSIEKQLLDDIYKDFLVLQKERTYPQLYHSKYIYYLKRLSPKSKKECIFIWIDSYANYANNSKDMFEVSGCLLDLFTYLLNNVGQLSENELNQISSRLINSYTATSSWNWDHIPWVNSLFAHIKCIVNEGKNSFFDLPLLDVLQNKISYFFANPQLNDIINSIAFFKKGILEDIKYEIFEDKLYQYIDSIVENDINGLLFGDLFNYSKSEVDKSIPSRKWLIEAQSIIASRNNDEFENSVIGLFDELITLIEHEHSRKRVYCDFGIYLDPATEQSIRGLVWVSSLLNSKKLNSAVYELGLVCLKKKPGVGGLSTKIGNACIYVFSNMPEKEGMAYLVKYKNTLKLPSTLKIIEKYIAELAKKSGKSAYDLEDLA